MKPEETKQNTYISKNHSILMLSIVTSIITMPVFMILYQQVPPISIPAGDVSYRIDHILTFFGVFFLIYFLVKKFRVLIYGSVILGLCVLTATNFWGNYGLSNLYQDYASFLFSLREGAVKIDFQTQEGKPFLKEKPILKAIDYKSETVRTYAANCAVRHFDKESSRGSYRKIIHCFSIFKEIRNRWRYVYDPLNEDYYAKASETVKLLQADGKLKGDCDDYSILIAATIKAIGGEVRLVRTIIKKTDGSEIGHLYPEVLVGNEKDLETISYLIKHLLFQLESKGKQIYYHIDSNGNVWLNFDYNDLYPGGQYQNMSRTSELRV